MVEVELLERELREFISGPRVTVGNEDILIDLSNKFMTLGPQEKQDIFLFLLGMVHHSQLQ